MSKKKEEPKGYQVGGIDHERMVEMVNRRFNALKMCKRGVLATEINERKDALGHKPHYTEEEKEKIDEGLAKKVHKAMSPSLTVIKKYKGNPRDIANYLHNRAEKVRADRYKHPGAEAWTAAHEKLNQEQLEREAELDSEIQDAQDELVFGLKELKTMPATIERLEAKQW